MPMFGRRLCASAVFFCLWALLGAPAALPAAVVSVSLPPEKTVAGPRLILGELAFIDALSSEGLGLAEAISRIDLGEAPAAGRTLVLSRAEVEERVAAARLILIDTVWSIPPELRLTGQGHVVDEEEMKKTVLEYLARTEPYRSGAYELISLNFGALPKAQPEEIIYRFVPQSGSNPASLSGYIHFIVGGRSVSRARVAAQIDLTVPAVVAARPLSRGHVLAEGDLRLGQVPFAQAKEALTDPAAPLGSALKFNVAAGEVVGDRHLTKSVMVRRGEAVTMIARQGGLKVTAAGQARQDGALGDVISVTNLSSKKNVSARITGPNTVEIIF